MTQQRRNYFRVSDNFTVISQKVDNKATDTTSKVFTEYAGTSIDDIEQDNTIPSKFWEILVDIDTKLTILLNKICLGTSVAPTEKQQKVVISAGGMEFIMNEKVSTGDIVQVKMSLPLYPNEWFLVYGKVLKVKSQADDNYLVVLQFLDLSDEVKNKIIYYTINHQRETIRLDRHKE